MFRPKVGEYLEFKGSFWKCECSSPPDHKYYQHYLVLVWGTGLKRMLVPHNYWFRDPWKQVTPFKTLILDTLLKEKENVNETTTSTH